MSGLQGALEFALRDDDDEIYMSTDKLGGSNESISYERRPIESRKGLDSATRSSRSLSTSSAKGRDQDNYPSSKAGMMKGRI